ncbi:hypothetical protein pdam_00005846 [Pocillopora damicornis]|uniref:Ubiquitin-related modifier 1 homolog n=2 Tax=Pocillopora damicornis TaxID=46731 RepID=A0A3M6U6F2_POCDA|nr:hypothetical protein pdam_00005846 [Pocillopora damicornis]
MRRTQSSVQRTSTIKICAPGGNMADELKISIQFSGGAELLFNRVKEHDVVLQKDGKPWNIKRLLAWIKDNLLKERPELFVQGESVRPGILVLINEADWELMGELDYELQENDNIVFISTLHGG